MGVFKPAVYDGQEPVTHLWCMMWRRRVFKESEPAVFKSGMLHGREPQERYMTVVQRDCKLTMLGRYNGRCTEIVLRIKIPFLPKTVRLSVYSVTLWNASVASIRNCRFPDFNAIV